MTEVPALTVSELDVDLESGASIVKDVALRILPGRLLGLVGESGSGKTTTALTLLGFTRRGVGIASGQVIISGHDILTMSEAAIRQLRGRVVSYVPQDPATALNPSLRVETQLIEVLNAHGLGSGATAAIGEVLERVGLPSDRAFRRRFPHQLSGGQQQRLAIAAALVCQPSLVVMDEPTTGLDVVTQAAVLHEVRRLQHELGIAIVYVSHNLAVVGEIADDIAVMYAGRIVEMGPTEQVLRTPRHPYTRGLIEAIPDFMRPRVVRGIPGSALAVGERLPGCVFAPRCDQRVPRCEQEHPPLERVGEVQVRCFEWRRSSGLVPRERIEPDRVISRAAPLLHVDGLWAEHGRAGNAVVAARDVSFAIARGEVLALVGESGSGKTTIGRCIAGLHDPTEGIIMLDGVPIPSRARHRPRELRRRIQIVFQNPYDSLNPRRPILDQVARPAVLLRSFQASEAREEAGRLLEQVGLSARLAHRYPTELSGGERQRVAIARALAAGPDLIICDEITSALDVSVQATVLNLLRSLQQDVGLALLLISHDLGVVAAMADQGIVLEGGNVREQGDLHALIHQPTSAYTRRLIEAAPRLSLHQPTTI